MFNRDPFREFLIFWNSTYLRIPFPDEMFMQRLCAGKVEFRNQNKKVTSRDQELLWHLSSCILTQVLADRVQRTKSLYSQKGDPKYTFLQNIHIYWYTECSIGPQFNRSPNSGQIDVAYRSPLDAIISLQWNPLPVSWPVSTSCSCTSNSDSTWHPKMNHVVMASLIAMWGPVDLFALQCNALMSECRK